MKTKLLLTLVGILITVNANGQQWAQSESYNALVTELSISSLNQIHVAGERVFTASFKSDFNYALYYSNDNGASWDEATSDNTTGSYAVFANVDADTIYSYGADLFGTRYLRKSTNAGAAWAVQTADYSNFSAFFTATQFAAINDTLILTSTARSAGILKSVDGGATWDNFIEFSDNDQNKAINGLESYGDYFFLSTSTNGRGLFRAHRDSARWVNVLSINGVSESMYGFDVDAVGNLYALTDKGIQFSENSGETWTLKTSVELGITETGTPTHIKVSGSDLIVAFANGSDEPSILKVKKDFSEVSKNISEGFSSPEVKSRVLVLATNSTSAFATRVGLATVLYVYNGEVSTSTEEEGSIQDFRLSQNYPNPFNPATNISFNLPEAGEVSLKVYNLLGQEVASIVNGRMNAGFQQVNFDASNLASGTYIYRLVAGTNVQTRKMMLIK